MELNNIRNRFDLLYGTDFDLYELKDEQQSFIVAVHQHEQHLEASIYLLNIPPTLFNDFLTILQSDYPTANSLHVIHSKTFHSQLKPTIHAQINLPTNPEAYDTLLSGDFKRNMRYYAKRIERDFAKIRFVTYESDQVPPEIFTRYVELRTETRGANANYLTAGILSSEACIMYVGDDIAAISFIKTTDSGRTYTHEGITYNNKYHSFSVGLQICYHQFHNLIQRQVQIIHLSGIMDYKKHFIPVLTQTYSVAINFLMLKPPKYLLFLAHLPKPLRTIAKWLLPHTRQKKMLKMLINASNSYKT